MYQRTPRKYQKQKAVYWEHEIKEKRRKQLSSIQAEKTASLSQTPAEDISIGDMLPAGIRKQLEGMGIITRVRNISKLQQMYNDAMLAATNVRS